MIAQRGKIFLLLFLSVIAFGLSMVIINTVLAHGTMETPVSRALGCFLEGPESPSSDACLDAVAIGGVQPLYDWNEINIANANGNHQALIPDGQLCSAGNSKYAGFDQARADWPATNIQAGSFDFSYRATAPHPGGFELFITKVGYDPTQPLKWSDLESFAVIPQPPLVNGSYKFTANIPAREGRHLIYSTWQRNDSGEAFYTCSDVIFPGGGPTPTSTAIPGGCTAPAWKAVKIYDTDDVVSHEGREYRAKWWTQGDNPAQSDQYGVWEDLGACGGSTPVPTNTPVNPTNTPVGPTSTPIDPTSTPVVPTPTATPDNPNNTWAPNTFYATDELVQYNGQTYRCRQSHTAYAGWEPPNVPALWELVN